MTTAVYLNYSSNVKGYEYLTYYSYPRTEMFNNKSLQYYYFGHNIHKAPDFDQFVQVEIDLETCECDNTKCISDQTGLDLFMLFEDFNVGGLNWTFIDIPNTLDSKLTPGKQYYGSLDNINFNITCPINVTEQIHCVIGPGFMETC